MVQGTYDANLVLLSILIATVASYTALDLAGRITAAQGMAQYAWLITAAAVMGGGIWSMHFVAMLAFSLPMPTSYDLGLTLLSLVLPILVTGVGFIIVNGYGTGALSVMSSGVFMGLGIVAMHYTGMAAMRMAADLSYDRLWVAISVIIAIGAASTALWLAFRNTGIVLKVALRPSRWALRYPACTTRRCGPPSSRHIRALTTRTEQQISARRTSRSPSPSRPSLFFRSPW
jgi:NO-binding membrane sensor protein with MHYT domain